MPAGSLGHVLVCLSMVMSVCLVWDTGSAGCPV